MVLMASFEIDSIDKTLKDPDILSNIKKCHEVIKQVSRLMNKRRDLRSLFVPMIKLLSHNDIAVKKCVFQYITQYAHKHCDVAVLCVSSLVRETQSGNPMIRGSALRTLTSLRMESSLEHMTRAVTAGLSDNSSYVRRIAVTSCLSIQKFNNMVFEENGYIDRLYSLIRDPDPIVAVNCLCVLDEALATEGGIVLHKNIAYYLLNDLSRFGDSHVTTVLRFLSKYVPDDEDEVIDIVNLLDSYLQSDNLCVALSAVSYVMRITNIIPQLQNDILQRSTNVVVLTLIRGSHEEVYNMLEFLDAIPQTMAVLAGCISNMFCKHNDPPYLKIQKLAGLPKVTVETTCVDVVEDLFVYCVDNDREVCVTAFRAVSKLMVKFPSCVEFCVSKFRELVETDLPHVIGNILDTMQDLVKHLKPELLDLCKSVVKKHRYIECVRGKLSFLQLLCDYSKEIQDCPYVIEDAIDVWLSEADTQIKSAIFTATTKIFLAYPAQTLPSMQRILEACWLDRDVELCDRARLYYRLLVPDPHVAASVILGDGCVT